MTWKYCILHKNGLYYLIEGYFDEKGSFSRTEPLLKESYESVEDLKNDLRIMLKDLEKPTIVKE